MRAAAATLVPTALLVILLATVVIYTRIQEEDGEVKTHEDYLKKISVKDSYMSYVDTGGNSDRIVVFIHGNPTSSYLWRNIYPNIASIARCFAPDLIGMGRSGRDPNITYTFAKQYEYFSEWMDKVIDNKKVNLVVHDVGSLLGFHWATQHREQVESIVHMESLARAYESRNEVIQIGLEILLTLRSDIGENMILEGNLLIDIALPRFVMRNLTSSELREYKRPFAISGEGRRPMLTWVRQEPIRGDGPDDVIAIVDSFSYWLSRSASIPKLYIKTTPGYITPIMDETIQKWPNQKITTVRGVHFPQEDSPNDVSDEIYSFLSELFSRPKHEKYLETINVKGSSMSYVDTGGNSNKTVVFLHGNPTSSYLWRNIYPNIAPLARCFAPDLIGMGRSAKVPNITYTFLEHYEYLSAWMNKVIGNEKVNLVIHDSGSGLGFHWANQHRDQVESIVHMESIVGTFESRELSHLGLLHFRTPEGQKLILEQNAFVEVLLPMAIIRNLTDDEMNEYRRPFTTPGESRRPTATWPAQIPIKGEGPDDVVAIVDSYNSWLSRSENTPKLFIRVEPGALTPIADKASQNWPNHKVTTVRGIHFVQEDSPNDVTDETYNFLKEVFNRI